MQFATAFEAVQAIQDNEYIWCHSMAATPYLLLEALCELAPQRKNLTLMQLHTERSEMLQDPALEGHLRQRAFFVGSATRQAVNQDLADYVPILLSEVPKLFRERVQRVDTALIQVSPPDRHGFCSLGVSVEATRAAVENARRVIAWVNPSM